MDQLTHLLTGVMLSRAGFNRWSRHARWVLPVAAVSPDFDLISAAGGTLNYLHYHRGPTHSLVMVPVMALVAVLLVRLFVRRGFQWRRAYAVALAGVASHLLLDWTNIYGVRFFLPFSGQWIGLGIVNVVNIWIWLVLTLAVVAPFVARLVSSEIGARPSAGRGYAIFALSFIACHAFGCWVLHARAMAILEARVYEGAVPVRVAAAPNSLNPFRWNGVVETEPFFVVNRLNLLEEFDPTAGKIYYKPEPGPALEGARRAPDLAAYARYSPFLLWRVYPSAEPQGETRVEAMDLRFGTPDQPRFIMTTVLDDRLSVKGTSFVFDPEPSPRGPPR